MIRFRSEQFDIFRLVRLPCHSLPDRGLGLMRMSSRECHARTLLEPSWLLSGDSCRETIYLDPKIIGIASTLVITIP
ncbi:hypothetical protein PZA11_003304 [Diplocarpon coronariae]